MKSIYTNKSRESKLMIYSNSKKPNSESKKLKRGTTRVATTTWSNTSGKSVLSCDSVKTYPQALERVYTIQVMVGTAILDNGDCRWQPQNCLHISPSHRHYPIKGSI